MLEHEEEEMKLEDLKVGEFYNELPNLRGKRVSSGKVRYVGLDNCLGEERPAFWDERTGLYHYIELERIEPIIENMNGWKF
jgi:hypothetical protein